MIGRKECYQRGKEESGQVLSLLHQIIPICPVAFLHGHPFFTEPKHKLTQIALGLRVFSLLCQVNQFVLFFSC